MFDELHQVRFIPQGDETDLVLRLSDAIRYLRHLKFQRTALMQRTATSGDMLQLIANTASTQCVSIDIVPLR